ncbi:N-acetyltransferase [Litchfieldella qijiaojingensis]|uniref:N-acetyltransferase n=1 Tax=Litchfieldella qijiaojingensis TaxID=980347 RepID=A0ABQ2Z4X2_9GAMM|nr:GNAT family protein [Halomonas qijiaojingensis]GGY05059.1 N-acetyltransferase [Halomonas qijiaojingensis]
MMETNAYGQPVGKQVEDWRGSVFPEPEPMSGRLVRVEPLDVDRHANDLHAAFLEPSATPGEGLEERWTYLGGCPFENIAQYRDWLAGRAASRDPSFYAIVENASGEALGMAAYLRIEPEGGSIEVGHLHFTPRLKRTPSATEAMMLMMRRAFALGYRRYEWKCDALNAPSRRAAERLGFRFEGIFRQHRVVAGRNRDTAWFSILDSEWPALENAFTRWLSPDNFDGRGRQHKALSTLTHEVLA